MVKQYIENSHCNGRNPFSGSQSRRIVFQPRGTEGDGAGNQMKRIAGARVFNSFIMKKMLTGLIEPIFFCQKICLIL